MFTTIGKTDGAFVPPSAVFLFIPYRVFDFGKNLSCDKHSLIGQSVNAALQRKTFGIPAVVYSDAEEGVCRAAESGAYVFQCFNRRAV